MEQACDAMVRSIKLKVICNCVFNAFETWKAGSLKDQLRVSSDLRLQQSELTKNWIENALLKSSTSFVSSDVFGSQSDPSKSLI